MDNFDSLWQAYFGISYPFITKSHDQNKPQKDFG